jgi:hypothetical protein
LGRAHTITRPFENFAVPFGRFLERIQPASILDLCSGSGDAACLTWHELVASLGGRQNPILVLSDLFPNRESFQDLKIRHPDLVDFISEPVDALQPPPRAPRVRSFFNCLHHFRPHQVKSILQDAVDHADGVIVFEVTGRTWKNMFQTILVLPFAASFLTVFLLRPRRFRNLLWGLLVPVVPLTAVFDGVVSNLRTYTVGELAELVDAVETSEYAWEIDTARMSRPGLDATYLLGWRKSCDVAPSPTTTGR